LICMAKTGIVGELCFEAKQELSVFSEIWHISTGAMQSL